MRIRLGHRRPALSGERDLSVFRRAMFWDVNMDNLSVKRDKAFIIERVLSGSMKNPKYLDHLEKLYSIQDIKKVASSSNQLRGNDSIAFIADRYHMDVNSFKQFIPII